MKTLISDHDYELRLGSHCETRHLENSGCHGHFRNLHGRPRRSDLDDENFYGVALIALVDVTVAALPFFLFTLPAGALAR